MPSEDLEDYTQSTRRPEQATRTDHSVHASQRACVSHGLPKLPFAQPAVRDSEGHGVEHTRHQYEAKLACRNSVSHTHPG